jgi:ankyrin repeat protein
LTVVQRLLEGGANVNAQNNKGATPLAEALMSAGPRVEIMALREKDDDPKPRREVSSTAMVQFLIANGADVNVKDKDGVSPLHWAFTVADAKALLAAGANIKACQQGKKTLADLARERGNQRLAKFWNAQIAPKR